MRPLHITGIAVVAIVSSVLVSSTATGGPLDPPPGAIQSTDAVLLNAQDVTLPYTITEPGLYRLTSDLQAPFGVDGFIIEANDVTIDCNGFAIRGSEDFFGDALGTAITPPSPGSGGTSDVFSNLRLMNGTIEGWSAAFDDEEEFLSFPVIRKSLEGARIENMTIRENTTAGRIGEGWLVKDCSIYENSVAGLFLISNATIRDCEVFDNNAFNIRLGTACVVRDCRISGGDGFGVVTAASGLQNNCRIFDNTISSTGGLGIDLTVGADHLAFRNTVIDCLAPDIEPGGGSSEAPVTSSLATATAWDNIVR